MISAHRERSEKAGRSNRAFNMTSFVDVDRLKILAIRRSGPNKTACDLSENVNCNNMRSKIKIRLE